VYVFRELGIPAGNHQLTVRFEREPVPGVELGASDGDAAPSDTLMAARAPREAEERTRRQEEAVPPTLELVTDIDPGVREVLLVTYDIDQRALVLRTRAPVP